MRKVAVFLTVLVLAAPAALAATGPRLRIARLAPLTIAASGFKPGERVTVSVRTERRRVRAGSPGSFVVTFADVRLDRCGGGFVVQATGALGSVVTLKMPRPMCLPARGGGSRS